MAAFHWSHIEANLTSILRRLKNPKISVYITMVDPKWEGIHACNPDWKDIVTGTLGSIKNFKAANKSELERLQWKIEVNHYQFIPQLWGILLNNSVLFLSTSYWDGDRLRGGHNQVSVIRADDSNLAKERISEFSGWFDYCSKQHNEGP